MSITFKNVDGDLALDVSNGRPIFIRGAEKLSQDAADVLMTELDPERDWGSEIGTFLNTISEGGEIITPFSEAFLRQRCLDAIGRLKRLQFLRPDQLEPEETVDEVDDVYVIAQNRTSFVFYLNIRPVSGPNVPRGTYEVSLKHQALSENRQEQVIRDIRIRLLGA